MKQSTAFSKPLRGKILCSIVNGRFFSPQKTKSNELSKVNVENFFRKE